MQAENVIREVIDDNAKRSISNFLTKKRNEIVNVLVDKKMLSHGELAEAVNTSPASLSNILLKFDNFEYKLIDSKTEGKFRYYYVTDLCKKYIDSCTQEGICIENAKIIQHETLQLVQQVKSSLVQFQCIYQDDWEFEFDDALFARINCQKISPKESESLVDLFVIGVEKLLLYDYETHVAMALKLLEVNSILQTRLTKLLDKFDVFRTMLQDWNKGDNIIEIYDQLETVIKMYYQKEKNEVRSQYIDENSELFTTVCYILKHIEFRDRQDISDCFMRFMAGNNALSGYMAQTITNNCKEEECK